MQYFLTSNVSCLLTCSPTILIICIKDRMPPQIGHFISQAIYDSQLESNPEHPITMERMACHFINIPSQELPHGTSWKVSCFISITLSVEQSCA